VRHCDVPSQGLAALPRNYYYYYYYYKDVTRGLSVNMGAAESRTHFLIGWSNANTATAWTRVLARIGLYGTLDFVGAILTQQN